MKKAAFKAALLEAVFYLLKYVIVIATFFLGIHVSVSHLHLPSAFIQTSVGIIFAFVVAYWLSRLQTFIFIGIHSAFTYANVSETSVSFLNAIIKVLSAFGGATKAFYIVKELHAFIYDVQSCSYDGSINKEVLPDLSNFIEKFPFLHLCKKLGINIIANILRYLDVCIVSHIVNYEEETLELAIMKAIHKVLNNTNSILNKIFTINCIKVFLTIIMIGLNTAAFFSIYGVFKNKMVLCCFIASICLICTLVSVLLDIIGISVTLKCCIISKDFSYDNESNQSSNDLNNESVEIADTPETDELCNTFKNLGNIVAFLRK